MHRRDGAQERVDRAQILTGQVPIEVPRHRRQDRPRHAHVASGLDRLDEGVLRPASDPGVLVRRQVERVADAPRTHPGGEVARGGGQPRAFERGRRREHGVFGMAGQEARRVLDRSVRSHDLRRVAVAAADGHDQVLAARDAVGCELGRLRGSARNEVGRGADPAPDQGRCDEQGNPAKGAQAMDGAHVVSPRIVRRTRRNMSAR